MMPEWKYMIEWTGVLMIPVLYANWRAYRKCTPYRARPALTWTDVQGRALKSTTRYQSHGGGIPATLHQEFWLRLGNGVETVIRLVNAELPIREGNDIHAVYLGSRLMAVTNRTTGQSLDLTGYSAMPASNGLLNAIAIIVALFTVFCVVMGIYIALPFVPLMVGIGFIGYQYRAVRRFEQWLRGELYRYLGWATA